jgi:hypothetical protein
MKVRVTVKNLPTGFGSEYVLAADGGVGVGPSTFEFEVEVMDQGAQGPEFRGKCVRGRKGERFLYLVWQQPSKGPAGTYGRVKIMLDRVPLELARNDSIAIVVGGTDRFGRPACARPPILQDWRDLA